MPPDGTGKPRRRRGDRAVAIVVGLLPFGIGAAAHFGALEVVGAVVIIGAVVALLAVLLTGNKS
jgi:hypothetical protein